MKGFVDLAVDGILEMLKAEAYIVPECTSAARGESLALSEVGSAREYG